MSKTHARQNEVQNMRFDWVSAKTEPGNRHCVRADSFYELINARRTRWTKNRWKYFKLSHIVLVRCTGIGCTQSLAVRLIKIFSVKVCRRSDSFRTRIQSICRHNHVLDMWVCVRSSPRRHASTHPSLIVWRCLSVSSLLIDAYSKYFVISVTNWRRCFHVPCRRFHALANIEIKLREKWFSDAVYHAHDIQPRNRACIHIM